MGEALLKKALVTANKPGCVVGSAGLGALVDYPPDPTACQLMLEKGIDISGYRARQINHDLIRKADLILVMESAHKTAIDEYDPSAKGKVFRLGEWGKYDIIDPYRKDIAIFIEALDGIERGVADWVGKL